MTLKILHPHKLLGLRQPYNKTQYFLEKIGGVLIVIVVLLQTVKLVPENEVGSVFHLLENIFVKAVERVFKWTCVFFIITMIAHYLRENWYLGTNSFCYLFCMILLQVIIWIWNGFSARVTSLAEVFDSSWMVHYVHLKVQCLNITLKNITGTGNHNLRICDRNANNREGGNAAVTISADGCDLDPDCYMYPVGFLCSTFSKTSQSRNPRNCHKDRHMCSGSETSPVFKTLASGSFHISNINTDISVVEGHRLYVPSPVSARKYLPRSN